MHPRESTQRTRTCLVTVLYTSFTSSARLELAPEAGRAGVPHAMLSAGICTARAG